ncbi:hypothetical protein SNE40_005956 [Patella caerulea]|uniref:Uncharacterized protein n=1 Tax=Patella caerulea TaxID=87958 RepID=A0AAN8K0H9_PATCE
MRKGFTNRGPCSSKQEQQTVEPCWDDELYQSDIILSPPTPQVLGDSTTSMSSDSEWSVLSSPIRLDEWSNPIRPNPVPPSVPLRPKSQDVRVYDGPNQGGDELTLYISPTQNRIRQPPIPLASWQIRPTPRGISRMPVPLMSLRVAPPTYYARPSFLSPLITGPRKPITIPNSGGTQPGLLPRGDYGVKVADRFRVPETVLASRRPPAVAPGCRGVIPDGIVGGGRYGSQSFGYGLINNRNRLPVSSGGYPRKMGLDSGPTGNLPVPPKRKLTYDEYVQVEPGCRPVLERGIPLCQGHEIPRSQAWERVNRSRLVKASLCPVPGCGYKTNSLKIHVFDKHLPPYFRIPRGGMSVPSVEIVSKRVLAVRALARAIPDVGESLWEIMDKLNRDKLIPADSKVDPATYGAFRELARQSGWVPIRDFSLHPLTHPALLTHWRVLATLLGYLSPGDQKVFRERFV